MTDKEIEKKASEYRENSLLWLTAEDRMCLEAGYKDGYKEGWSDSKVEHAALVIKWAQEKYGISDHEIVEILKDMVDKKKANGSKVQT